MKALLLSLFLFPCIATQAQPGNAHIKCLSGNCITGAGEAEFIDSTATGKGIIYYKGDFKDGKMDGEGTMSSNWGYYTGSFKNGDMEGYGIEFKVKKVNGVNVPDSGKWVSFGKWADDGSMKCIQVHEDGSTGYYNTQGSKDKSKDFRPYRPVKDKWIQAHADAYIAAMTATFAARKAAHDAAYPERFELKQETKFISIKSIGVVRGQATPFISWDCLTDRDYFISASGGDKGGQLPFGGYVTYQVLGEDNAVVFEGSADTYWRPAKEGRYTFVIKFDQGNISGDQSLYVDNTKLKCSLMYHKIL